MQAVLLITAGLVLGLLVALIVQRIARHRRERRRAMLDLHLRPLVLSATIAEDDEMDALLARVRALTAAEQAHVRRAVFTMLRGVTGEAADRLRDVAHAAGLVPRVVAAVQRRSAAARADAAEALGLLAPDGAVDLLLVLADDRDAEVRTVAIRALGGFDDVAAMDRVIAALASDSGVPASVAATALLQQGTAALARVRWALDDPDRGIRRGAARVAGLLQLPAAAGALTRLLGDAHPSVRLAAIRSLEHLPVRAALVPLLEAALADGAESEAAAATLAAMPPAWTTDAMARVSSEGSPAVRRAAGLRRREVVA